MWQLMLRKIAGEAANQLEQDREEESQKEIEAEERKIKNSGPDDGEKFRSAKELL